jgi:hypothetical protein
MTGDSRVVFRDIKGSRPWRLSVAPMILIPAEVAVWRRSSTPTCGRSRVNLALQDGRTSL